MKKFNLVMLVSVITLGLGFATPANAATLGHDANNLQPSFSTDLKTVDAAVLVNHVSTSRPAAQVDLGNSKFDDSVAMPLWGPSSVEINSTQYGVDMPQIVDSCQNPGSTCTITQGQILQTTISANAGVNIGMISAGAGVSYAESYTVTTACTSPVLGYDQTFAMRPQGTFIQFTYIERVLGIETGRYPGSAFVPTGVSCIVR